MSLRTDLTRITRTVVAPAAVDTDRAHRFPRAAVRRGDVVALHNARRG